MCRRLPGLHRLLPMVLITQVAILGCLSLPAEGVVLFKRHHHPAADRVDWTGRRLPDVDLATIDGGHWGPAHVADRPTVLFVMDDCGPCAAPFLTEWDRFQREHPQIDVVIASVSPLDKISKVARSELEPGSRILTASYAGTKARDLWQMPRLPRVLVLERGGRVSFARVGSYDGRGAMRFLENRLNEIQLAEANRGAPR